MKHIKGLILHHGKKHKHFILYALIGLTGVTIDYLLFVLGTRVLGLGILVANFVAISAGIINNFWLNSRYNFKKHDHIMKRFALFYAIGLIGLVLSEILIGLFHYSLGLNDIAAKALTLPPVLVFQFFFNKRFSFGDMQQTQQQLIKTLLPWRR